MREGDRAIFCFEHRIRFEERDGVMVCPSCAWERVDRVLVGRYRLTRKLGATGFGQLLAAKTLATGAPCLVHLARPEIGRDPETLRGFDAPARLRLRVRHPNVLASHEVGRDDDGAPFYVDEMIYGTPLSAYVEERGGRLPLPEVAGLAPQMAAGLDAVHAAGIVHRDVKPLWFLRCQDRDDAETLKLVLSHEAVGADGLSGMTLEPAVVVGTVRYLAPDQARGKPVDRRSDLYAFGMTLYRLIAGVVPFQNDNLARNLLDKVRQPLPHFRELAPEIVVPEEIEAALRALAAFEPEDRPATAIAAVSAFVRHGGSGEGGAGRR